MTIIKLIHLVIFFIDGDYCSSLTSMSISKMLSNQNETENDSTVHVRSRSIKFRLWLGLGFNSLTCGLLLGTIIYHLIPHV